MLCVKQRSESYPDYHGNMNAEVFERCFANTLIPNLQKKKKPEKLLLRRIMPNIIAGLLSWKICNNEHEITSYMITTSS